LIKPADRFDVAVKYERRRHPRHPIAGKVKLYWKSPDGRSHFIAGTVVNISKSGALVDIERPIPLSTVVQIESSQFRFAGICNARFSTAHGLNWRVGLEFSGGMEWRGTTPPQAN